MRVLIVGLGLIGGSIAKTLKRNSDFSVFGFDCSQEVLTDALKTRAIDSIWNGDTEIYTDITVLCTSPEAAVEFLQKKAVYLKIGSVVTDVCGVKQYVVEKCRQICFENGLHFIGGHPMAGKERSGFKNSDENLFNRASYILTPTPDSNSNALETVKQYVEALKCARVTVTTPEIHDRMIAFTSQLPHIIAGAYVKSPSCLDRKGFSAGSFKDVSRVATVDEELWTELFLTNSEALLPELDCFIENLQQYRDAISTKNSNVLKEAIKQGRIIKERDLFTVDERIVK